MKANIKINVVALLSNKCVCVVLIFFRYGTIGNFDLYRQDYIILYVDTIREIVRKEDPSRPFVVSSPSNGKASEEEGHIARDPYSELYGDGKPYFVFIFYVISI